MKVRLAKLLGKTRLASTVLRLRRVSGASWITVLSYHRAGTPGVRCEYDEGVVDVVPEVFDRQLAFLKRTCSVITLEEMLGFVHGARLPDNPVLLTFDDGYRDNHDVVLPILQRHGVQGTFFIATSYIEERRLFWWDRIHYVVKASRKEALELDYPRAMRFSLASNEERGAAAFALARIVKDDFGLDLERFLDGMTRAADVLLSREEERRRADALLMTWDHVRALRRGGMAIASHTSTHRVLQTLPRAALDWELATSKKKLEDVLGEPIRAISYPVGKAIGASRHIREAVAQAGYELGFSNCSGVNDAFRFDPLDARRVATDGAVSDADFHGMIAVPYLAT